MISKTKESGRADLLIRMPPELKERIEKAARLASPTASELVTSILS
jgi:predicted DNA-binding protein